jgi:hypothetical protein
MMSEKYMIDSMGDSVPMRHVSKYDRTRDAAVRRIYARFAKARQTLERVMSESLDDLQKVAVARGEEGIKLAEKGNLQVSSFDGLITVGINVRYEIKLDERVVQARELMFACARRIGTKLVDEADNSLLEVLIEEAFQPTRSGALPVARVLSLMRREVRDPQWQEAKRLLAESMETHRGKSYLRVEARPDRQHDPVPIRLDIADCWPETKEVQP